MPISMISAPRPRPRGPVNCERAEVMLGLPGGGLEYLNLLRVPDGYRLESGEMSSVTFGDGSAIGLWIGGHRPDARLVPRDGGGGGDDGRDDGDGDDGDDDDQGGDDHGGIVHRRHRFLAAGGRVIEVDVWIGDAQDWEGGDKPTNEWSASELPDRRVLAVKIAGA